MMSKIRIIHLIFSMKFINAIYVTIVMQSRQKMLHIIHTHKKNPKNKVKLYIQITYMHAHRSLYGYDVCMHSFIHSTPYKVQLKLICLLSVQWVNISEISQYTYLDTSIMFFFILQYSLMTALKQLSDWQSKETLPLLNAVLQIGESLLISGSEHFDMCVINTWACD